MQRRGVGFVHEHGEVLPPTGGGGHGKAVLLADGHELGHKVAWQERRVRRRRQHPSWCDDVQYGDDAAEGAFVWGGVGDDSVAELLVGGVGLGAGEDDVVHLGFQAVDDVGDEGLAVQVGERFGRRAEAAAFAAAEDDGEDLRGAVQFDDGQST